MSAPLAAPARLAVPALDPSGVLRLQATAGNAAVATWLGARGAAAPGGAEGAVEPAGAVEGGAVEPAGAESAGGTATDIPADRPAAATVTAAALDEEPAPVGDLATAMADRNAPVGAPESMVERAGRGGLRDGGAAAAQPPAVGDAAAADVDPGAAGGADDLETAPAADGGASDVDRWQSEFTHAIGGVEAAQPAGPRAAAGRLAQRGRTVNARRKAEAPDAAAQAQAVAGPAPPVPPAPEPEPDAVTQALSWLRGVVGRGLRDQTLPALERTPQHAGLPDGGGRLPAMGGAATVPAPPSEQPAGPPGPPPAPADVQADELRKRLAAVQPQAPVAAAAGQGLTLHDPGPQPDKPPPPAVRAELGDALVVLIAKADDHATEFAASATAAAYRGGALDEVAPEIRHALAEPLKTEIRTELDAVATASGLAVDQLHARAEEQRASLEADRVASFDELATAGEAVRGELQICVAERDAEIAGAGEAARAAAAAKEQAVTSGPDPAAIEARRDGYLASVSDEVAQASARVRRAREGRASALAAAAGEQIAAYALAAEQQAADIKALHGDDVRIFADPGRIASRPTLDWGEDRIKAVKEALRRLDAAAAADAEAFDRDAAAAASAAREQIHEWAAGQLGRKRSWLDRIRETVRDARAQAEASTRAWQQEAARANRDAAVADHQMLAEMRDLMAKGNAEAYDAAIAKLSLEQRAVLQAYIQSNGSGVMAVATGVLVRIRQRRLPELVKKARDDSLALERFKDPVNWEQLNTLGRAQRGDFNAGDAAREVRDGIDRWGTEEDQVYAALRGSTPMQAFAIRQAYKAFYEGDDIEEDIKGDFSGSEEDRALAMVRGDQKLADAIELDVAMTPFGPDEDAIMRVLRNKSPAEVEELSVRYKDKYKVDLGTRLAGSLRGHGLEQASAHLAGETDKADAFALRRAMDRAGTDEDAITAVYTQIRQEVEAAADGKPMITAEIEAEVKRRVDSVRAHYDARSTEKGELILDAAFKSELSGGELELARGLAANDHARIDAAKLRLEAESTIYVSDSVVNTVLRAQGERARTEVMRDTQIHFEKLAGEHPEWDDAERKRQWAALEASARTEIATRSKTYMGGVEHAYDAMAKRSGMSVASGHVSAHGLAGMIEHGTSGTEQEIAKRIRENGRLEDWEEIKFAVQGADLLVAYAGTDEDVIKRVLRRRTKDQLNTLRAEYAKHTGGRNLDKDVLGDLSGRDHFDVKVLLMGEPETEKERLELLQMKRDYETAVGPGALAPVAMAAGGPLGVTAGIGMYFGGGGAGLGTHLTGEERRLLLESTAEAEKAYAEYEDALAEFGKDHDITKKKLARFRRWIGYGERDVEEHREEVDAIADGIATAAAFVAGIAVIAASGGTATPAVLAAAAAASGATSIATKMMLKGPNAYGWEDIASDSAMAVVDIAAAYLTAGIGNALLRSEAGGVLAVMARSGRLSRMSAHFMAEGIENALGGIPSALLGATLSDDTWRSPNPLAAGLQAVGITTGQAFALGGGLGALGAARGGSDLRVPGAGIPKVKLDVPVVKGAGDAPEVHGPRDGRPDAPGAREGAAGGGTPDRAPDGSPAHGRTDAPDATPGRRQTAGGEPPPARFAEEEAKLDEALPPDLRGRRIVTVVDGLKPGDVEVRYEVLPPGVVAEVHMRVGRGTSLQLIRDHVSTVRAMQRYAGFSGRIRALIRRATSFITGHPDAGPGSLAWEVKLEVDKLQLMVNDRTQRLAAGGREAGADAELRADIANLESQLAHYQRTMDAIELDPAKGLAQGKGYVAALSAETWFPAVKAEVQAIEATLLAAKRPDLTKTLDEIAELHKATGTTAGFEAWVRSVATRDADSLARELVVERRRLTYELAAPPGAETERAGGGGGSRRASRRPSKPDGYPGSLNEFGRDLGWPTATADGTPVAEVDLAKLRRMGVTEGYVREQAAIYREVEAANPFDPATDGGNPTAGRRAAWLEELAARMAREGSGGSSGVPPGRGTAERDFEAEWEQAETASRSHRQPEHVPPGVRPSDEQLRQAIIDKVEPDFAEAWEVTGVSRTENRARGQFSSDPLLGDEPFERYYVTIRDDMTGRSVKFTLNRGLETGRWGTIKLSSNQPPRRGGGRRR